MGDFDRRGNDMAVGSLIAGALISGLLGQGPPPGLPWPARPRAPAGIKVPREYVRIELNGNPEEMLAEFLKTSNQDGVQKLLAERLKWLQQNPEELRKLLDRGGAAGPLADDPYLKELVAKF